MQTHKISICGTDVGGVTDAWELTCDDLVSFQMFIYLFKQIEKTVLKEIHCIHLAGAEQWEQP